MSNVANPLNRRWHMPRWSMATMFLGVAAVCVVFQLVMLLVVRPAEQQKRAAVALRQSGAAVLYDYEQNARSNQPIIAPGPDWLRDLIGVDYFADVTDVSWLGPGFGEVELRHLRCFTNLNSLRIIYNKMAMFPPTVHKSTSIFRNLGPKGKELTTLPPEIGRLTTLTELYLYENQLTTLPSEIGKLTNLRKLIVDHNELTTLPPEIGLLTKLTELNLANNQLTTLPPEIGQLKELTFLWLQSNPVVDADLEYLKSLKSLMRLDVTGTKVTKDGIADLKHVLPTCYIESDFVGVGSKNW